MVDRWTVGCMLFVVASAAVALCVTYNPSLSLPRGLYVRTFVSPSVGSIVKVPLPESGRELMQRIGMLDWFDKPGNGMLKPVVAVVGDTICRDDAGRFFVNGALLGHAWFRSPLNGEPLPSWDGCRKLAGHEIATFTDYGPLSIDSRYLGVEDGSRAVSYIPLLTWN